MFRLRTRLTRIALFVGIVIAVLAPAAASAQMYPTPSTPSCVYPNPDPSCASVAATNTSPSQGSSLPFTGGGQTLPLAIFGTVMLAGGVALVVYSRRRSSVPA